MAIYTRTGDEGKTDLLGGVRVAKDAALIEVCGTLDELNALLGLVRCEPLPAATMTLLEQIQRQLFDVGAELVAAGSGQTAAAAIHPQHVAAIEQAIDRHEAGLEPPGTFILPAGCRAAATLHIVRAVCRRAERRLVSLADGQPQAVAPVLFAYVNRLSDLLYVLARESNARTGISDAPC